VDAKNEENNSVLAGRSLLLSSQYSHGRFDPFPTFLRPATQAKIIYDPSSLNIHEIGNQLENASWTA